MASKDKYAELADAIVAAVGGKDNISYFAHCVTRLRFSLKDKGLLKKEDLEAMAGVLGSQWAGDQFQVIIGQAVADVYASICERTGLAAESAIDEDLGDGKKKLSVGAVLDAISGCIVPLIPMFIGSGFLKIVLMLCEQAGVLSVGDPTHTVLTFVGDAGFYFLPIFVGAMAARKFNANMGLGMFLGAMLVHPSFMAAVAAGDPLSIVGIPILPGNYMYSIFPVLLAVAIMAPVERFFARHSPEALRSVCEPFFTLLVMIPITLCAIAPLGSILGTYLSNAILALGSVAGPLAVAVLAAALPWLTMTGMHVAFSPYMFDSFARLGTESLMSPASILSNINQGVACLAVSIRSKDVSLKSTAASCAVTGIVAGIIEPALFGVTLRLRTPMYGAMIGSFVGGLVAGIGNATAYAMAGSAGLLGGPLIFLAGGMTNVMWILGGIAIGAAVTFIATWILYKPEEA